MKKILPVFLILFISFGVFGISSNALADSSDLSIPPTTEGPGAILPDSPFYFLDELKQNLRLAFAVTPSMKAKVYSSVAGERIAELRFELMKNNIPAAELAIRGVKDNTVKAAEAVKDASAWGVDLTSLAKDINLSIKQHMQSLDELSLQATGGLKAEVVIAQAALGDAKSIVEKNLPKADQENEMLDDLRGQAVRNALMTADFAAQLQSSLTQLQNAKTTAISTDNTVTNKKTLTAKQKQDLSQALQKQSLQDAETIAKKAEDIANSMMITQKVNAPTPTPTGISK